MIKSYESGQSKTAFLFWLGFGRRKYKGQRGIRYFIDTEHPWTFYKN